MYMSLHHSNWITWVVALWLFNVTCFHIQIEAKDLFYMFYKLQDASCTQSGIIVGSLNRVPFWAGMSHCTTWQERNCPKVYLVQWLELWFTVQKVKIRQKLDRKTRETVGYSSINGGVMALKHYYIRWCMNETMHSSTTTLLICSK